MSFRITKDRVKKYGLAIGAVGVPVGIVLFTLMINLGALTVADYDSNIYCGGDEVCWLELRDACFVEDVFIYPMEGMELINAEPTDSINSFKLYRSWGSGLREIKLNQTCKGTWCGGKSGSSTNKYVFAFRKDRCYDLKIEVYKTENSTVAWSINPEGEWLPNNNYTIDGDKIFINDSKIFLSVSPHTLNQGNSIINLELLSKVYTGDINLIFGFDEGMNIEKTELYKPYNITKKDSFTCSGNTYFEYTLNPNWLLCVYNDTVNNTDVVLYNDSFDGYNLQQKTVWKNKDVQRNWKTLNFDNQVFDYEYGGVNKWIFIKNISIVENKSYNTKVYFNTVVDNFKYWVCIMPSIYGNNVKTANDNGHLYCLDPYVSTSYDYWRQNTDEEDVYIRVDLDSTDNFTLQIRNDSSYSENGFNVFDFFDSFDVDGDLNSTLWDATFSGNAIVNVTDSALLSASFHTNQLPLWKTYENFSSDYNWSLEFRYKAKNSDTTYAHFGFGGYSNFNHFKGFWNSYNIASTEIYSYWLNGTFGGSSLWGLFSRGTWREWNITINKTSIILSNSSSSSHLNTATGLESVIYNVGYKPEGTDDNEVYFDDIRVYKIFEDSPVITYAYGSDHINITFDNTGLTVKENYTIELHDINLTGDLNITYSGAATTCSITTDTTISSNLDCSSETFSVSNNAEAIFDDANLTAVNISIESGSKLSRIGTSKLILS